jgi:hypothetical protein
MFVEVSTFLLTPLSDEYKLIDGVTPIDFRKFIGLGIQTLVMTPFSVIASWFAIFYKINAFFSNRLDSVNRALRRHIKNNPLYNYGASETLRENLSSNIYEHYFQLLDKEMYTKIIERTLLDTFATFMDDHNIDTSDFRERQTSISNNGIIVQGGDVNAGAMAVGTGAKAQSTTPTRTRFTNALHKQ